MKLISLLSLFIATSAYALPDLNDLSNAQIHKVQLAKKIAIQDGHTNPNILPAIILKESNAGERKQNGPNLGIAQVTVQTAIAVITEYPELGSYSRQVLRSKLLNDDTFNMKVASKYLKMVQAKTIASTITAYNLGPAGSKRVNPDTHNYTVSILKTAVSIRNMF